MSSAPENCGFTPDGDGFVRLWLTGDDTETPGRDLWVDAGSFYPLAVQAFEFPDDGSQHPAGLLFEPGINLGGYSLSQPVDEDSILPLNVGAFVLAAGEVRFKRRGEVKFRQVTLDQGAFYGADVEAIELVEGSGITYLVVVSS